MSGVRGKALVCGLSEHTITSLEQFAKLFEQANQNKSVDSTIFNSRSSRAHSIYRITIRQAGSESKGVVSIIDLAGCEKFSGEEMKKKGASNVKIRKIQNEAIKINQSLGSLRKIFQALMESRFAKSGFNFRREESEYA